MIDSSDLTLLLILYLVNYLLGSIPFSFIIGKLYGKDIRKVGSLNVGASNVLRECGKTAGALAYAFDIGKGVLTAFFSTWWITKWQLIDGDNGLIYSMLLLVGFFTPVIGHIFPIYLKFKGGKGVATSAGVLLVLMPVPALGTLSVFALIVSLTKTISLGSMTASLSLPWILWIQYTYQDSLGILAWQTSLQRSCSISLVTLTSFLAMFIVYKHSDNIRRLFDGTERDFKRSKKP